MTPRYIPPMGWGGTLLAFGAPAVVLYVTTHLAIPSVTQSLGLPPVVWFMTFGAFYVLAPLLVIALMRLRGEALEDVAVWRDRLRFRPLRGADWTFAFGAFGGAALCSYALFASFKAMGVQDIVPTFLANSGEQALSSQDLLFAWVIFGALSVASQEILWRGVYLPRQEQALGAEAWLANAVGWFLFLLPLGWHVTLILLPVIVAVPFVTQKRGTSWAGATLHALAYVLALVGYQALMG